MMGMFDFGWKGNAIIGTAFFWPALVGLGAGAYKGYCARNGIAIQPTGLDLALQFGPAALGAAYYTTVGPFSKDQSDGDFVRNVKFGALVGGVPTVAGYIASYIAGNFF